jgi:hypothetical protein
MLPLNFGGEVFEKNRSHPQTAILLHRIAVDSFLHDDPLAHHVLTVATRVIMRLPTSGQDARLPSALMRCAAMRDPMEPSPRTEILLM